VLPCRRPAVTLPDEARLVSKVPNPRVGNERGLEVAGVVSHEDLEVVEALAARTLWIVRSDSGRPKAWMHMETAGAFAIPLSGGP